MNRLLFSFLLALFALSSSTMAANFTLPDLPYDAAALEPYIDSLTMTVRMRRE